MTNDTGADVKYKMYPWYEKDVETLENSGTVTIPPGMVVEFYPDLAEAAVSVKGDALYEDTDFEDLRGTLNTTGKYAGKMLWDDTTGAPVWAAGGTAISLWVDSAAATVYTPVSYPDAFVAADWALTDLSSDGDLNIEIIEVPYDSESALTDIEYSLDGGDWTSLGAAIADDYPIVVTTNEEHTVAIRAVNAVGESATSDTKSATATV
jgi:hypothetical protein